MPNIILEYMDTFVFGFGLSASLEAQYSAGDCGKSDFFLKKTKICKNSFSFQENIHLCLEVVNF